MNNCFKYVYIDYSKRFLRTEEDFKCSFSLKPDSMRSTDEKGNLYPPEYLHTSRIYLCTLRPADGEACAYRRWQLEENRKSPKFSDHLQRAQPWIEHMNYQSSLKKYPAYEEVFLSRLK